MNQGKNGKPISHVVCSVNHCAHNDKNGHCVAKQIEVGPMRATSCAETVCATFKPESEQAEGRIF